MGPKTQAISAVAPTRKPPQPKPIPLPTLGKRRYLDYEETKMALRQAGLFVSPQPLSRYYVEGRRLRREENGQVLQSWEME